MKVDEYLSGYKCVNYGVPQGSILGPLFFIIYVNDLLDLFKADGVQILLYADDTVLYYADKSKELACREVEKALVRVSRWCDSNKLTINAKKTQHMLVSIDKVVYDSPTHCINMGDCVLKNVDMYNYLGVHIDRELIFDEFFKQKCNKINLKLYHLLNMRKFITSHIATTLYKQAILPLFDYADFLIDSSSKYYVTKLDNLHAKALRLIDCNRHRSDDTDVLENIYLLDTPLRRRKDHHCMIMYRLSKLGRHIDRYRPTIRLRSRRKVKFKKQKRNLEKIMKSPLYRGVKLWDMIPEDIQRSVTKVKFKTMLKSVKL